MTAGRRCRRYNRSVLVVLADEGRMHRPDASTRRVLEGLIQQGLTEVRAAYDSMLLSATDSGGLVAATVRLNTG